MATHPGRFVLTQMAELPFLGTRLSPCRWHSTAWPASTPSLTPSTSVRASNHWPSGDTHGPGIVFNTKRPIVKPEDLQGLKFRVGGGMVNEISKTLGMNVTLKPAPDSYELLSTGVMDGTCSRPSPPDFQDRQDHQHATVFPGACTTPVLCS